MSRCTALAFPLSFAVALTLALPTAAPAQVGTVVPNNANDQLIRIMGSNNRALAVAPDGALWTMYARIDAGGNRSLVLTASRDGGKTWTASAKGVISARTGELSTIGAIAIDRDCNVLHVGWAGKSSRATSTVFNSSYYRQFDLAKNDWIGPAKEVAVGYGSNNQFNLHDIVVTPKGTVVLAITGHRSGGGGVTSWGGGLLIKKRKDKDFPKVDNVNRGLLQYNTASGVTPSLQVVDEVVHLAFRDSRGLYGPHYSVFDTETMSYTLKALPVGPGSNGSGSGSNVGGGNIHNMLVDSKGGKYVLWIAGTENCRNPKNQGLRLAYAPPGKGRVNGDWQDIQVFRDIATTKTCNNTLPNQVKGGNSSERYYALSSAGDSAYVVFSKPEDQFKKLYYNFYRDGKALLKQPLLLKTSTVVNAFEWITGFRNAEVESGVMFLTYGERDQSASPKRSGTIQLWRLGVGGNAVSFGTGCQGNLKQVPRVRSDAAPSLGSKINVLLDRHPNNATLFLAFGFSCQKLDLGFMGAPGCSMETTFPIILGTRVGAQGALTIPFQIPNNSSLLNSGANMQSFVSAPGANAAGALTSNAIALRF